jgi:hypothetical protein
VRQEDIDLFNVFRWTVFAMIGAPRNRSKKFHRPFAAAGAVERTASAA